MNKKALFSLNDTTQAASFAASLINAGWDIIGSAETVKLLTEAGLPVVDIAMFTGVQQDYGFPPTLHAKVEAALTSANDSRIDLVYVLPYPLAKGNDVGGRTLLALAAKGARLPVLSLADMEKAVAQITAHGDVEPALRRELIEKVWFELADHYGALAAASEQFDVLRGKFEYPLLNGENPYQVPAGVFSTTDAPRDALCLSAFTRLSGVAPCFTNIADADCILQTMALAAEAYRKNTPAVPYVCVAAKHGNPCGFGVSRESPAVAVERALFGNPRAIWGGELIVNFAIDASLANALVKSERRGTQLGDPAWMLDIILAPSFSEEAVTVLGKRKGCKLFQNPALFEAFLRKAPHDYRFVRGGFLRQPPADYVLNVHAAQGETPQLAFPVLDSLIIAWATAFTSNHGGNEVALAKDGALLGIGGGPSTIEAAEVAVSRAKAGGHDTVGATFAADAFFPFTDAPSVICGAGVTSGVVPAGGKREADVRAYFVERGVSVVYLPPEFRGFCRH